MEEFFHGILHFDSKAWRTLPQLAFRPGTLTHNYIHGHRVRYVSPLALFLFTVFLMFFVFARLGSDVHLGLPTDIQADARAGLTAELDDARADLTDAEADLAEAVAEGGNVERATERRDAARSKVEQAEEAVRGFDTALRTMGVATPAEQTKPPKDIGTEVRDQLKKELKIDIGNPTLEEKIKKKLENPDLLIYKLQNTAYKFSWMLIPISLPFICILFAGRRDVYMYDHVIFSLYSLSFMSLLFILYSLMLVGGKTLSGLSGYLLCAIPVHMYFHLKGTYGLGRAGALWRTAALLVIASVALVLFVLFILSMGFTG
ncbi:DUF3667 domain-containing protein [Oleisolibacter albus]|uniref:DUF3667 domain-containing protein n=1 Tax=Oleisolibacter albus TaxID=2171757 RepID=UPI00139030BD|nr:DUF3667 domain-containing protein [Oleisolibacter albus]